MRMPCDLIQDLLPLYHDQVCSQTSRKVVEDHLQDCPACQQVLDAMGGDLLTPAETEEEKELRPLAEWWQKQKKKSHLNTIVYTLFLVIILGVGYYFATWYVEIPVSVENLEVSHIYELSDGRIAFNIFVEGDCGHYHWKHDGEGNVYLIPKRMFPARPDQGDPMGWNEPIDFYIPKYEGDTLLPETVTAELAYGTTSVYVGPVGKGILVWEKGDNVPRASEEWEEMIEGFYEDYGLEYRLAVTQE